MAEDNKADDFESAAEQSAPLSDPPPANQDSVVDTSRKIAAPARAPRTLPVTQEQFEEEIQADRLHELQISLFQITLALAIVVIGILYILWT